MYVAAERSTAAGFVLFDCSYQAYGWGVRPDVVPNWPRDRVVALMFYYGPDPR